ncbi:MAG: membrane protein insertion efficiency factor YidD [Candidatus Omnitrophota bacterium]
MKIVFIRLIKLYQMVSARLSPVPTCRFSPSCSDYAISAIRKYGFFYGLWKSLKRLLRCHGLSAGGFDPLI